MRPRGGVRHAPRSAEKCVVALYVSACGGGLLLALLAVVPATSRAQVPVLAANSATVDIRDGDLLLEGGWVCDPTNALDIYSARASRQPKRVTFTSDIDSIAFDVLPGRTYDFVILLGGRDACRARISTMRQGFTRSAATGGGGATEIPIAIRHGKLHLQGSINGSKPLDLIFDTGADIHVLYPSAFRKGADLSFDGSSDNVGTGGSTRRQTSSANRLEIAGLRWEHEPVLHIERQADRADGIIGYPAFEHCVVEFDFERMVMVVHDSLPAAAASFTRTPMPYSGSLTAVEAVLAGGAKPMRGLFLLDTGGSGSMNMYQEFAAAHGLPGTLRRLGSSTSRGVGGSAVRNMVVVLPELRLAGFALRDVPIHIGASAGGHVSVAGGTLNMDVLRRFDAMLDYPNRQAYFRPNGQFEAPFKRRSGLPSWAMVIAIAVAITTALLAGSRALARPHR